MDELLRCSRMLGHRAAKFWRPGRRDIVMMCVALAATGAASGGMLPASKSERTQEMQKVYTIYWKQPEEYTSDLRVLDGDFKQVYPTGFEFNPNSTDVAAVGNMLMQPDRTFVERMWTYQGLPVDMTHAPTRVQYTGRLEEMADVMRASSWFVVSERFRSVVERLEPGKHQFQPVELVDAEGNHLAHYFWLVPCARVDGMDREHTTHEFYKERSWRQIPGKKYVVSLKQTAGHHLWIDPRTNFGTVFISQELHDALEAANLGGLGFGELDAI
ncbi:DUF1629 domain-containing protein (plasmid) [Nitratireductor sp. GISD-1A_MAKvit]|uniref:imm11 family protein n=1 Tax=Nitratireductor sp. GISD-1A_MAKvit TaxID=3234198 RepID=UPI003467015D